MIELPYPAAILSPNARAHWGPVSSAKAKHRKWAYAATRAVMGQLDIPVEGPIRVAITAYPGTNRNRDADNLIASCKAYLDGVADALGINDTRFVPSAAFALPVANPRVVITLSAPFEGWIGELVPSIMERVAPQAEAA